MRRPAAMLVSWTHADLVALAARHLRQRHAIVATEVAGANGEQPDAIGWTGSGTSTLIECKVSRSDFQRDAHKFFRRNPEQGMGMIRYYLAPPGLLMPDDVPPSWGLLEPMGRGVVRRAHAQHQPRNHLAETAILVSCLRRLGVRNLDNAVSIKAYTIDTGATATLGIQPPPEKDA